MRARLAAAVAFVVLVGCQSSVPETGVSLNSLGPVEKIGVDTTDPALVNDVYRVDVKDGIAQLNAGQNYAAQHYTAQQLAQLPVGEVCTIQLNDNARTIVGRIEKTSPEIVVLSEAKELFILCEEQGVPMASKIPYVSRMFKNVGMAFDTRPLGSETLSASEVKSISVMQPIEPVSPSEISVPAETPTSDEATVMADTGGMPVAPSPSLRR